MSLRYTMLYQEEKGAKNVLVLSYKGETLQFPISNQLVNSKLVRQQIRAPKPGEKKVEPESMVEIVDTYLKQVPDATQEVIFNTFKELEDLVHFPKREDLMARLQSISYKIYNLEGIRVGSNGQMRKYVSEVAEIPGTVFESMDQAPNSYHASSTYLVPEYLDLVEFNMFVKIMFPLMVIATPRLQSIYGKRHIINVMQIVCFPEICATPAFHKMEAFVQYFAENNYDLNNDKTSGGFGERLLFETGIASTDVVEYSMAEVIIRRSVAARSLRNIESTHIVVRMYARLNGIRDGRSGYVDKNIANESGTDPHKSVIDDYRVKDTLEVDIQVQMKYIVNLDYLSLHLKIDRDRLESMFEFRKKRGFNDIDSLQVNIIRMTIGHEISPESLNLLSKEKMNMLALATHLYIRANYPELIGLAGVLISIRNEENHGKVIKNLDKPLARDLLAMYPFELNHRAEVNGRKVSKKLRIVDFIKQTCDMYQRHYSASLPKNRTDNGAIKAFNSEGGLIPVIGLADELGTLIATL